MHYGWHGNAGVEASVVAEIRHSKIKVNTYSSKSISRHSNSGGVGGSPRVLFSRSGDLFHSWDEASFGAHRFGSLLITTIRRCNTFYRESVSILLSFVIPFFFPLVAIVWLNKFRSRTKASSKKSAGF